MSDIFLDTKKQIESLGFNIIGHDFNRPWGGFLLINESQSQDFINTFISKENLEIEGRLSPKILIFNTFKTSKYGSLFIVCWDYYSY